ncbi:MAG TPA: hypothetical protein VMX18_01080 [Candidatus Bipolaricaulota bacterium]|nr:hypothetical protein [Candidatus Bipolaricaulota bacterium]
MPRKTKKQTKKSMLPCYIMIITAIIVAAILCVGGAYLWYYTAVVNPIQKLAENQITLSEKIEKMTPLATEEAVIGEVIKEEEFAEEEENEIKDASKIETGRADGLNLSNKGDMTFYTADLDKSEFFFRGKITVTGNYTYYKPGEDMLGGRDGNVCFDNIKQTDIGKFPKFANDDRNIWFCFTNQELAKKLFGPAGSRGEATIEIDNYMINLRQTEVYNTAELVKVIEIK